MHHEELARIHTIDDSEPKLVRLTRLLVFHRDICPFSLRFATLRIIVAQSTKNQGVQDAS